MSSHNPQKQIVQLPILSKNLLISSFAAVRPARMNKIRVQRQLIKNKIIFHNYGHGSSGISISPGTALQISQMICKQTKNQKIAIIGSGIAGLTSALELAERGYKVNVYAKVIPNKDQKDNNNLCTSQVAGGFWHPTSYIDDKQIKSLRAYNSYKIYQKWMNRFKGINQCYAYIEQPQDKYDQIIPTSVKIVKQKAKIYFSKNSNKYKTLMKFKTFKINPSIFLQQLIQQCKKKGVIFKNYTFSSIQDILNLQQQYIVNCLGIGSKQFFNDNQFYGLKGHHLYFENPLKLDYIIQLINDGKKIGIYGHKDKIILGMAKQQKLDNNLDPQVIKSLLNNYINFKQLYELPNPKL